MYVIRVNGDHYLRNGREYWDRLTCWRGATRYDNYDNARRVAEQFGRQWDAITEVREEEKLHTICVECEGCGLCYNADPKKLEKIIQLIEELRQERED